VIYLGSLDYFLAWGSHVAEWQLLGKDKANGGTGVCNLLSLVMYPKRTHFTSLTLSAKY
jgi:hypothetical protein